MNGGQVYMIREDIITMFKDITGANPEYFVVKQNEPLGAKFWFDRNRQYEVEHKVSAALGSPSKLHAPWSTIKATWFGLEIRAWRRHSRKAVFTLDPNPHLVHVPHQAQITDRYASDIFRKPGDEDRLALTLLLHPPQ